MSHEATVLAIVQDAMAVIGLTPRPSSVIGSTSAQLQTLIGLSELGGEELAQSHRWEKLTYRTTFAGSGAIEQVEPQDGYDRFVGTGRIWDVNRKIWLIGPMSPDEWDGIITKEVTTTPAYWCMYRGFINIYPAPTVNDSFRYSWVTRNWIRPVGASSDGSGDVDAWE